MKTKILLLCGLLLATISCKKDKPSVDLQKGLVSYFNFDDNLKDQKGYAGDGVPTGNPTFTAGKIGKALTLNGTNQKVLFTANPAQSPNGITTACWMNVSSVQDGIYRWVFRFSDKNSNFGSLQINQGDKIIFLTSSQASNPESTYASQTWMHVVLTFDGNSSKLYINGVLKSNYDEPASLSAYFNSLNIGYNSASNRYLQGSIDELYIYNRALSQAEVTQLYNLK